MQQEVVETSGHLVDSHIMEQIFDVVVEHDGTFEVEEFRIGLTNADESYLRLKVTTPTGEDMEGVLNELVDLGCTPAHTGDAELAEVARLQAT